jgi:3-deoxy-manno-octulosonate cytidylyltransferase (CMP-KDO synthetase)
MTRADALIVIPARFASTRYPGKPLEMLRGAGGVARPLIEWSWRAAMRAADLAEVVVATDDQRIAATVAGFGGTVVMTSSTACNGTERCTEALAGLDQLPNLVINLQGDSPLIRRGDVAALIDHMRESGAAMSTAFMTCDEQTERRLLEEDRAGRVGGTTLVTDLAGRALYFSKRVIPFRHGREPALKLHLGLYAYTPAVLGAYVRWGASPLELAEGLEQLRFLENGIAIDTVEVPPAASGFWEVNHREDMAIVEAALATMG